MTSARTESLAVSANPGRMSRLPGEYGIVKGEAHFRSANRNGSDAIGVEVAKASTCRETRSGERPCSRILRTRGPPPQAAGGAGLLRIAAVDGGGRARRRRRRARRLLPRDLRPAGGPPRPRFRPPCRPTASPIPTDGRPAAGSRPRSASTGRRSATSRCRSPRRQAAAAPRWRRHRARSSMPARRSCATRPWRPGDIVVMPEGPRVFPAMRTSPSTGERLRGRALLEGRRRPDPARPARHDHAGRALPADEARKLMAKFTRRGRSRPIRPSRPRRARGVADAGGLPRPLTGGGAATRAPALHRLPRRARPAPPQSLLHGASAARGRRGCGRNGGGRDASAGGRRRDPPAVDPRPGRVARRRCPGPRPCDTSSWPLPLRPASRLVRPLPSRAANSWRSAGACSARPR